MSNPTDEQQIRQLITQWATAVHAGDLDRVLVDHTDDIVMFDVPPPDNGLRGRAAYAASWPQFFEYQARGGCFELVELDIVAGAEVAFAHALLRCGNPAELAAHPDRRLRLTLGLVKRNDRWQVQHEHHSFPLTDDDSAGTGSLDTSASTRADNPGANPRSTASDGSSVAEIQAFHDRWFADTAAKNLDGMMAAIAPAVVSYEHDAPLAYLGREAVRKVCAAGLATGPLAISWAVPDLTIITDDDTLPLPGG